MNRLHLTFHLSALCTLASAIAATGCGRQAQSTEENATPAVAVKTESSQTAATAATKEQVESLVATGNGMEAIRKAADAEKYLLAFFWKGDDDQSIAMRRVFDQTVAKVADRADSVAVNITDESQKEIVEKYGLERAPTPLVLAVAPNGAITGGFPTSFEEEDLMTAFVSPGTAKCIKPLQENKLVLLCLYNADTKSNEDAMKGIRDFKQDERYAEATEVVVLDPADSAEAKFLADLGVSAETETAITVLMAPPGAPIGMIEGPTTKESFVDMLAKAQACGPGGCGPGGCGP
ncbi:MAG: hypothetical protein ISR77_15120 [Pirellulaceae bacterium]|nr:hypothetical protein [Pirellulaceae bacterium]